MLSEIQYRFPLNYGPQCTLTAQWTVKGSGALLLLKANKATDIYKKSLAELKI